MKDPAREGWRVRARCFLFPIIPLILAVSVRFMYALELGLALVCFALIACFYGVLGVGG